ncbi:MAG: hypothetical protein VW716_03855 [Gammaproteobacteria bacterium]
MSGTFRVILHAPIAPAHLTSSAQPALNENYGLAITINTRQPQCPFIVEPSSFGFDKTPPAGRALTHIKRIRTGASSAEAQFFLVNLKGEKHPTVLQ